MTDDVTEMPRCFSISIQSDTAARLFYLPLTAPAWAMAPPYSKNFSVSVVLPASGCEMIAKVRRRLISSLRPIVVPPIVIHGGAALRAARGVFYHKYAQNTSNSNRLPSKEGKTAAKSRPRQKTAGNSRGKRFFSRKFQFTNPICRVKIETVKLKYFRRYLIWQERNLQWTAIPPPHMSAMPLPR